MTLDEVMEVLPTGPQLATILLPDGTVPAQSIPASAPYPYPLGSKVPDDVGNRPVIGLDWENGTDYTLMWPVDDVKTDGPFTAVTGPRGTLQLRAR